MKIVVGLRLIDFLIQEPYWHPCRDLFRSDTFSGTGVGAGTNGIGRRDRANVGRLIRQPTYPDGRVSASARESS